jgi:hypothetical protein
MKSLLEGLGATSEEIVRAKSEAADKEISSYDSAQAPETTQNSTFNAEEVHTLARDSLDFLGALAAPTVFQFLFPPVFISVWLWLVSYIKKPRTFPQLALGLPRGFGKTTVVKLFILYCILFTNRKFILVISNTAKLAQNIIFDVAAFLDEPNIKKVFGDWRQGMVQDTLEMKKFGFRGRNIVLTGIGAGTSLRGLNINNERPDLMIFEDIQSREEADSEILSNALEQWMVGTAMKAKSPSGCMFLFVANMYPTKWSILRRLKANPNWTKFIAGGILADGTSLWEDLQPIEQLKREFENDLAMGRPEVFYSEVLNDENAASNNLIDFSKVPEYVWPNDQIPEGNFVIIDPSGWKKKSDEVAVGYFEVHEQKPVLRQLRSDRLSPSETITTAIKFCLQNNCRVVAIESVAYQATLAYWFNFICIQMGIIGIEAVEIYPGGTSKNARILGMFKEYQVGNVIVHRDLRAEVHAQMVTFNPIKENNSDDILDLLTYAPRVLAEFGEYVVNIGEIRDLESESIGVIDDNCVY